MRLLKTIGRVDFTGHSGRRCVSGVAISLRDQVSYASAAGSNSRASSPGVRPDRTSSTICCRNAAGYGGLDLGIVDSSSSPRG